MDASPVQCLVGIFIGLCVCVPIAFLTASPKIATHQRALTLLSFLLSLAAGLGILILAVEVSISLSMGFIDVGRVNEARMNDVLSESRYLTFAAPLVGNTCRTADRYVCEQAHKYALHLFEFNDKQTYWLLPIMSTLVGTSLGAYLARPKPAVQH